MKKILAVGLATLCCSTLSMHAIADSDVQYLAPVDNHQREASKLQTLPPASPPKAKPFDWSEADIPRYSLDFEIDIPLVINGTIPIQTYTEQHYNLMRQLKAVEDALVSYYVQRERGVPQYNLNPQKREVYVLVGRVVTTMDGYAKVYDQDISLYMRLLQETIRQFHGVDGKSLTRMEPDHSMRP